MSVDFADPRTISTNIAYTTPSLVPPIHVQYGERGWYTAAKKKRGTTKIDCVWSTPGRASTTRISIWSKIETMQTIPNSRLEKERDVVCVTVGRADACVLLSDNQMLQ
jgi:hypothetical protein